jgi:hypothetical protein
MTEDKKTDEQKSGGVSFGDINGNVEGNIIAGRDITDVRQTGTTVFDQRGQQVAYQYNAAGDINFGAVQNKMDVVGELEKLQTEIAKAAEANALDEETAIDAESSVKKAVVQAKKPDADEKKIVNYLTEAKGLIVGVTAGAAAAAGLVTALTQAIELVQKFF